jgi:hypothetical protein
MNSMFAAAHIFENDFAFGVLATINPIDINSIVDGRIDETGE